MQVNEKVVLDAEPKKIEQIMQQAQQHLPVTISFFVNRLKKRDLNMKQPNVIRCLSIEECAKLQIDDLVDIRELKLSSHKGKFELAKIVDKNKNLLKVHYDGYHSQYDEWINYDDELNRFAKARTTSKSSNTRFQEAKRGAVIDVNIPEQPGWRNAYIVNMDKKSGQVRIKFRAANDSYQKYWVHLNHIQEVQQYITKCSRSNFEC